MKQYLCVEHGEEFIVDARDPQHAREQAAMWGGEFIREYKPRKPKQTTLTALTRCSTAAKLDRLKKQHVEVIKKMLLDLVQIRDVKTTKNLKGKVVLALDEDLWEQHRNLHWKIFCGEGAV